MIERQQIIIDAVAADLRFTPCFVAAIAITRVVFIVAIIGLARLGPFLKVRHFDFDPRLLAHGSFHLDSQPLNRVASTVETCPNLSKQGKRRRHLA